MPRNCLIILSLLMALSPLSAAVSHPNISSQQAIQRSQELNLAFSAEWQAILLYHPNLLGSPTGLIDSESFYLSSDGQVRPDLELEAFIEQLFIAVDKPENHLACRFPRRYKWVSQKLGLSSDQLPPNPCLLSQPGGFNAEQVSSVYLVFSSYFLESPASFFGHLFIRLESKIEGQHHNPMLDPIISFSAVHGPVNYLAYMVGGLSGWFPGIFEVMPMYHKVQQYTNHESRDLWEYRLALNQDQIENLVLTLYELRGQHSNYYYLSRNCSLLLAKLIEAVEPGLSLGRSYRLWATPPNLLQRITREVGDGALPQYHASNRARYLHHYASLEEGEKMTFRAILEDKDFQILAELPTENEARVLDTLIEYIDFDNRLAGPSAPERWADLRRTALSMRARNSAAPMSSPTMPARENPFLMQSEQRIGLGHYSSTDFNALYLNWRPTLKNVLSSSRGSRSDMGMEMFDLSFISYEGKIDPLFLSVLAVENYQPRVPHKSHFNLNFSLGYGHFDRLKGSPKGVEIEMGAVQAVAVKRANFFGGFGVLGQMTQTADQSKLFLEPNLGVLYSIYNAAALSYKLKMRLDTTEKLSDELGHSLRLAVQLSNKFETYGQYTQIGEAHALSVALHYYF